MGLDAVELLMTIEEEFGIHIDDDVASIITTPAEAADYIYTRVRQSNADPCLSQIGFYKLRRILVKHFNKDRNDIRPDSCLKDILGENIRLNWLLLKNTIDTNDFPVLERSKSLTVIAVFVLPAIMMLPLINFGLDIKLLLAIYALLSFFAHGLSLRMAKIIPRKYSTVSSLIPYVECSKNTVWKKDDILARVIEITSLQLGVPIEQIRKDSHFVLDLGAD